MSVDNEERQKMIDLNKPGKVVEITPEEAEQWGAFEEEALSEADAVAGSEESDPEVAFLEDDTDTTIPDFILTETSIQRYGWDPDKETLDEAIARTQAKKLQVETNDEGASVDDVPTFVDDDEFQMMPNRYHRNVPDFKSDSEMEMFLEQDLSELDFSQFNPVKFDLVTSAPDVSTKESVGDKKAGND